MVAEHKRAEIGYEIHPDQWRKGYTIEAVSKVLSFGFNSMDLTRIGAVVFIDNEASNNLLTKIGSQKEGVLRNYMYQNGIAHDTNVYSYLTIISIENYLAKEVLIMNYSMLPT